MGNQITKGLIAGLIATVVLSAVMVIKAMMGLMPAMNAIKMLTGMAHQFMGTPVTPLTGWILHFLIGAVLWGISFTVVFNRIPAGSPLVKGLIFGTAAWVLMMVLVMPLAGAGIFGLNLGVGAPIATLVLHWLYGAVLGLSYGKIGIVQRSPIHSHA